MKKTLALLLAIVFIVALFAGCGGAGTTNDKTPATTPGTQGGTQTGTTTPDNSGDEGTGAPVEEDSPYNFPVGKYEVDEDGFPVGPYDYEAPISTADEVFTWWTTNYTPQYIPEEGYASMKYPSKIRELTGVTIEYDIVPSDQMQQNFSVLMAADDLRDLSSGAVKRITSTIRVAVEDEYLANIYPYREYMPNYMYQAISRNDVDVLAKVFYDPDMVVAFYSMADIPMTQYGMTIRADWLEKWGGQDFREINTYDEMYEAAKLFKANGVISPLTMMATIEQQSGYWIAGYDTSGYCRAGYMPELRLGHDGKIEFTLTNDDDREAMTMINKWFEEDLIDKNWAQWTDALGLAPSLDNSEIGIYPVNPNGVDKLDGRNIDPDCRWEPLPRTLKTEGQMLKYGQKVGHFNNGSTSISAKCRNIPLMVTYLDWFYSYEGYMLGSYGVEGEMHYLNEEGKPMLTDYVLHHPEGLNTAFATILYSNSALVDAGLKGAYSRYAYEGGDRCVEFHTAFEVEGYKGEMDVPSSIALDDEESEILATYSNEIATYISENYLAFVDGSKPLTEWDSYVEALYDLGLGECEAVYQGAYERFMVRFNEQ